MNNITKLQQQIAEKQEELDHLHEQLDVLLPKCGSCQSTLSKNRLVYNSNKEFCDDSCFLDWAYATSLLIWRKN